MTMRLFFICLLCIALQPLAAEEGMASWYGGKFQGRQTASGEIFDTHKFTAAHRTLSFGILVKVTNLDNQRETVVRINDRGPFVEGRIIDVSRAAAVELDMMKTGVARVRVEVVSRPAQNAFYRIQVASFEKKENADSVRQLLTEKGFSVFLEYAPSKHIRVCVDKVAAGELEGATRVLLELGFSRCLVRRID